MGSSNAPPTSVKKFPLTLSKLSRRLHTNLYEQVAFAMPMEDRHTLVFDAEIGAGLRSLGNLQSVVAIHGGNFDFSTQGGL